MGGGRSVGDVCQAPLASETLRMESLLGSTLLEEANVPGHEEHVS